LLEQLLPVPNGVRLLGLTLSGLGEAESLQASEPAIKMIKEQRQFDF
jgi:hypothetical protein